MPRISLFVVLALCVLSFAMAFHLSTPTFYGHQQRPRIRPRVTAKPPDSAQEESKNTKEVDLLTKASWYGVEVFGKVFGSKRDSSTSAYSLEQPPSSVEETKARLQADNNREYFLSGEVDKCIYDDQCVFADPFVSFKGRDRFVENLANLGSFITKYSAKPLSYYEEDEAVVTKFMVKLELNLPWKPVLAWPWGVRCVIDRDTNLITLHEESWDIAAWEVSFHHVCCNFPEKYCSFLSLGNLYRASSRSSESQRLVYKKIVASVLVLLSRCARQNSHKK
jgi:hypothetical protein